MGKKESNSRPPLNSKPPAPSGPSGTREELFREESENPIKKEDEETDEKTNALLSKGWRLLHNAIEQKNKEIWRLRDIGTELIDKMCELCIIIDLQHENCKYCDEKLYFEQALNKKKV